MSKMDNKVFKYFIVVCFTGIASNKSEGFSFYNSFEGTSGMTATKMQVLESISSFKVGGDV